MTKALLLKLSAWPQGWRDMSCVDEGWAAVEEKLKKSKGRIASLQPQVHVKHAMHIPRATMYFPQETDARAPGFPAFGETGVA